MSDDGGGQVSLRLTFFFLPLNKLMSQGVTKEELVALQQFCTLDRQLRRHAEERRDEVRQLMRKKNELMAALLRTMQQRNMECVAVSDVVNSSKYARIVMSHTTRQITPTLVKEALENHFSELVEAWPRCGGEDEGGGGVSFAEAVPLLYSVVRLDRTRTKPIVSFSNCLPRGMKPDHVFPASKDTNMQRLVSRLHTLQHEYTQAVGTVRSQRVELQERKAEHVPLVDSFLTKREANTQMIVSKSGERLCLRRRAVHTRPAMSVAQFRTILETALQRLEQEGFKLATLLEHKDKLVDTVLECMDCARSILTTQTIQVLYMKAKAEAPV